MIPEVAYGTPDPPAGYQIADGSQVTITCDSTYKINNNNVFTTTCAADLPSCSCEFLDCFVIIFRRFKLLAYIFRVPLKTPSDKMCPFNTNLNPFNTHLSSDVTTRAENSQVIGGTNGVLTCQVTSGDAPSTCTWWKDSLQVRNLLNKLIRNPTSRTFLL